MLFCREFPTAVVFIFIYYFSMMAKTQTEAKGQDTVTVDLQPLLTPLALIISALILSVGLFVSLNRLGSQLSGGVNVVGNNAANAGTDTGNTVDNPGEAPAAANGSTTIDDDAVKGNKDEAKVAIVEFSDYECPFCKRFHNQTLSQLMDEYVDSNKAIFVYRDLPLDALHPNARNAALAAECAGDEGDGKYFEYHDKVFTTEDVLSEDKLKSIAGEIGLDTGKFNDCFDNNKYAEEIQNDESAASAVGINGTPGFIVGTLNDDGSVTGEVISGAVPFADFKTAIEKYL